MDASRGEKITNRSDRTVAVVVSSSSPAAVERKDELVRVNEQSGARQMPDQVPSAVETRGVGFRRGSDVGSAGMTQWGDSNDKPKLID